MEVKTHITQQKKLTFKGYDARTLKGLFVTDKNCANVLKKFSDKTELNIYQPNIASKSIKKEYFQLENENKLIWAQDYLTFINEKAKAVLFDNSRGILKRTLRAISDSIKKDLKHTPIKADPHLRGGNFFVCQNNDKKELLIVENKNTYSVEELKSIFNVEKVIQIPKMDYHLDLYLRPLDNRNVLVADINKTKEGMIQGAEKLKEYIKSNNLSSQERQELENVINNIDMLIKKLNITLQFDKYRPHETVNKVVEILKKEGYNPIRVPANYHYLDAIKTKEKEQELLNNFKNNAKTLLDWSQNQSIKTQKAVSDIIMLEAAKNKYNPNFASELYSFYSNNFINAIVNKKQNGDIIYITNASLLDKELEITKEIEARTGFSTKNMFINSIEPYVKKENIHFIDENLTESLFKKLGGIHCAAAEIPNI